MLHRARGLILGKYVTNSVYIRWRLVKLPCFVPVSYVSYAVPGNDIYRISYCNRLSKRVVVILYSKKHPYKCADLVYYLSSVYCVLCSLTLYNTDYTRYIRKGSNIVFTCYILNCVVTLYICTTLLCIIVPFLKRSAAVETAHTQKHTK